MNPSLFSYKYNNDAIQNIPSKTVLASYPANSTWTKSSSNTISVSKQFAVPTTITNIIIDITFNSTLSSNSCTDLYIWNEPTYSSPFYIIYNTASEINAGDHYKLMLIKKECRTFYSQDFYRAINGSSSIGDYIRFAYSSSDTSYYTIYMTAKTTNTSSRSIGVATTFYGLSM